LSDTNFLSKTSTILCLWSFLDSLLQKVRSSFNLSFILITEMTSFPVTASTLSAKEVYEQKKSGFLNGYQSILKLSDDELNLIPNMGVAVFIFYLGVQAQRFDWSNIFLSENYLKMYVGKMKSWMEFHTN